MEAHRGNDDRRVAAPGVPDDRGSPTAAPPPGISHLLDDEIGPSTDNESAKPFQGGSKREGSGGRRTTSWMRWRTRSQSLAQTLTLHRQPPNAISARLRIPMSRTTRPAAHHNSSVDRHGPGGDSLCQLMVGDPSAPER